MLKVLGIRFSGQPAFFQFLGKTTSEMYSSVGDGTRTSVVMAPLQWICRTFPEAPLVVDKQVGEDWEVQKRHPLSQLIERPNKFFSGDQIWWATVLSLITSGNGYWIKLTNRIGEPLELWWAPSWTMEPKWPIDGSEFISHYSYTTGVGEPQILQIEDVVHFRWGIDPENIRKGLSPLASVIREVFSDVEASAFAAALLKNMGVPGLMVSPDGDAVVSDDDLIASKEALEEHFTGMNRGRPFVAGAPTKVQQFGFSPQQMDLRNLRRLPEERVTAALGVPAIVAGLGAGLDRSTFANMSEAREMAYESGIIPLQRVIASDLKNQLLGDFEGEDLADWRCRFSLDEVRVLQEDENKIVERKLKELGAGAIMLSTYLRETGREAGPEHDIYLRPMNIIEIRADELGVKPPPVETSPPPPGLGNGNGGGGDLTPEERQALADMRAGM
jgi:HK97 family phage portal protein